MSVSQATRPYGSSLRTASSTPSEIWSAILSGCPSVTDSEVNRNSFSVSSVMVLGDQLPDLVGRRARRGRLVGKSRRSLCGARASALATLDEVDDQRHAVHAVASAQTVLQE